MKKELPQFIKFTNKKGETYLLKRKKILEGKPNRRRMA